MTRFDKWALVAAAIMGGGFMVALVTIGIDSEPYSQESIERVREMDAEIWANYEAQSAGWTVELEEIPAETVRATQPTEDERMTAEHDPDMWLTAEETETEAETTEETEEATEVTAPSWADNDATCAPAIIFNEADAAMLQKLAWAEGGTLGVEGMAHIMRVVLNRVESPDFPNTVADVINAPGQFTVLSSGAYDAATPNAETQAALDLIQSGWDETHGATYFTSHRGGWHEDHLVLLYTYEGAYFWTYLADH